jgi:hypothetical protein
MKYLFRTLWLVIVSLFAVHTYCGAQTDTVPVGAGIIEGRVIVGHSYLPNVRVDAVLGNRLVGRTRADSEGVYRLEHLPAGRYRVRAVNAYHDLFFSEELTIIGNKQIPVECDAFFPAQKKVAVVNTRYPDTLLRQAVDSIVVMKKQREMSVYGRGKLLKTYHICLGFTPIGAKHFMGDGKTPEGRYKVNCKNPYSAYHKSLCISYPSKADIDYARKAGRPTGGDVMIHGLPNGRDVRKEDYVHDDWTWGCIALTNEEIDDLYLHIEGQPTILIMP